MHAFNICNLLRPNAPTSLPQPSTSYSQTFSKTCTPASLLPNMWLNPRGGGSATRTLSFKLMSHSNMQSPKRDKKNRTKRGKKRRRLFFLMLSECHLNEIKVLSRENRQKTMLLSLFSNKFIQSHSIYMINLIYLSQRVPT